MTAKEALDLANEVLKIVGEPPLSPLPQTGTERQRVEAILHHYAKRLREKQPRFKIIKDDKMLSDIVIQRIVTELEKE